MTSRHSPVNKFLYFLNKFISYKIYKIVNSEGVLGAKYEGIFYFAK